jgi:cytosine/uracil/thiamine/allantoin permease
MALPPHVGHCTIVHACAVVVWVVSATGAFVGAGWFAIEGALGSDALYRAITVLYPFMTQAPYLGDWIGLNLLQLITVFLFWGASVFFAFYGAELLKKFEKHAATLLISASMALFIWAWASSGSISGAVVFL